MASTQNYQSVLWKWYLILINSPASTIKTIDHVLHCYHFMVTMIVGYWFPNINNKVKKKTCCFNKFSHHSKCFHGFDPRTPKVHFENYTWFWLTLSNKFSHVNKCFHVFDPRTPKVCFEDYTWFRLTLTHLRQPEKLLTINYIVNIFMVTMQAGS